MNFDDPFADDLKGFGSTASGLRRANALPAPSADGRVRDTAPPLFSVPAAGVREAAAVSVPGRGGGAASPTAAFDSSVGTSLFAPSSASAAPVAGRRARADAATASHVSGSPAPSENTAAPTQVAVPHPNVMASAPQVPPAATLSWLDDADVFSSPSVANSTATGLGRLAAPPPLQQGVGPMPASVVASAAADPQGAPLPSFLDFGGGGGHAAARPGSTAPIPSSVAGVAAAPAAAAAAAEADVQRKARELRDLYATLDALDAEQQRLEARLDERELKEEAELLTLQTSAVVKATELEEKEQEQVTRRAELQQHTAERLVALTRRYAEETAAQASEVRGLDSVRYTKQLQQVCDRRAAAEQVVRELREQAALLVAAQPYSEAGVRVALADAASAAAGSDNGEGSAADSSASPTLEAALLQAVVLLRGYCDQRLHAARERLVDYVHDNTLEAAHAVRRRRETAWAEDALRHKERFADHLTNMMQRYMTFYKERALLKQENMTSLQTELQNTAAGLRRNAAERLQQLLRDVTAKMALSTRRHTESATEASDALQRKAGTVLDGDIEAAAAQRQEVESRLVTETQARRQRHRAEQASLAEQLQRLRRCGEAARRDAFDSLCEAVTGATSAQRARPLLDEVVALKARLEERLHPRAGGSGRSDDVSSPSAAARAASTVARMHAEELAHVVRSSTAQAAAQQEAAESARQRCDELRGALTQTLCTETVERLQRTRSTQHAHQARLDAMLRTWAAAHRQNLSTACCLTLPISGSSTGVADAAYIVETYAAPGDATSTALLEVLQDRLHARDGARRAALDTHREAVTRCARRLEEVHAAGATLHEQWGELWSVARAQAATEAASHDGAVKVERGLATVEAEQRVVQRDRRRTARQCERVAEMAHLADAEAARRDVPLPIAPFVLQGSSLAYARPAFTLQEAGPGDVVVSTAQHLAAVDANVVTKPASGGSTFTAIHASTNAAAAAAAEVPTVSAPTSRMHSAASSRPSSSSSLNASLSSASPGVVPKARVPCQSSTTTAAAVAAAAACPASQRSERHAGTVDEASFATDTQPWSSSLARAEDPLRTRTRATSAASPPCDEGDGDGGGAARVALHPPRATPGLSAVSVPLSAPDAGERLINVTVEGSGGRVSAGARRESTSLPSRIEMAESPGSRPDSSDTPQHLLAPPTSTSSTSGSSELQTPSALTFSLPTGTTALPSPWHRPLSLQRPPQRGAATTPDLTLSHATWSTLEDYRSSSSADLPVRAAVLAPGGAVPGGDARAAARSRLRNAEAVSPLSETSHNDFFDDSGDFMPLLSCADSPTTSSIA